jgi:hypothetical protein
MHLPINWRDATVCEKRKDFNMKVFRKPIIMSREVNDLTACFQKREINPHKPYILDSGRSATTVVQKLAVPEQLLEVPDFNILFNDSTISPVGSELQNTEATLARPQVSLEEEIVMTKEETKFGTKIENFTIIIDILPLKSKEVCRKSRGKQEFRGILDPQYNAETF